jgi:SAM-dependent methyltransferase
MLRRKVGELGLVVGVDFSLNMTFLARRNFPFANVCVVDADASALPFADTCFDMALAFSSFPHFADHQCALNELCRILKPNARLYILHLVSSLQLAEIHRRVGGAVEEDRLPSNEILHDMLVRSGFANIEIEDKPNLYLARAVRTPENVPSCRP